MKTEQSELFKNQVKGTNEFKLIRGIKARARCRNWGSALYCSCGCQVPRASDLDYDLTGLTIKIILEDHWLNGLQNSYKLVRAEDIVGKVVLSYTKSGFIGSVYLDGTEYIDIDSNSPLYNLVKQVNELIENKVGPESSEIEVRSQKQLFLW